MPVCMPSADMGRMALIYIVSSMRPIRTKFNALDCSTLSKAKQIKRFMYPSLV